VPNPLRRAPIASVLAGIVCAVSLARATPGAAADVPGLALADRVEARLTRDRAALKSSLSHYALVFPVEQADLLTFMEQVRVFPGADAPGDLVLGTDYGLEPHGGGLLALLFDDWRPEGRAPRMSDRFPFARNHASLPLGALYASLRRQVFLPVAGGQADAGGGTLPRTPQLARIRLHVAGLPASEVDAYHLLLLLAAQEPDLSRSWRNQRGQLLSADLLLEQARGHYLASRDTPAEPADHSNLHLVEVLLAASRRRGADPDEIKRHFLDVELRRVDFEPRDATLLLGHYAESLGLLLADPRTHFDPSERRQVREWLGWLESSWFREVGSVDPRHLAHLLRGLRLVREQRARLDDP